jgi:hypothetical protein
LYGVAAESFPFEADGLIGSPLNPQVIHTNNLLLRKIYIHPGWNWISYNVQLPDPTVAAALSSLTNPTGGLIKGQTSFSSYFSAGNTWLGSLSQLSHLTMYQYKSNQYDSLLLVGMPVNASTPIPVVSGWNWLGYLPQRGLTVNQALASLNPLNGDIIKGQFTFAQYVAGIGWLGNLNFMSSPNGYLLRISNPGTLVYPPAPDNNIREGAGPDIFRLADEPLDFSHSTAGLIREDQLPFSHWQVNPQDYEYSMNLIAVVQGAGMTNMLSQDDEVGVFVGNQVRGSGKAIYIAALDSYMVFITIYANQEGELLSFKLFDADANAERLISETFAFQINSIRGTVEEPQILNLLSLTDAEEEQEAVGHLALYPNPASDVVYIQFYTAQSEDVRIILFDALGRELDSFRSTSLSGSNLLEWRPRKDIPSGMYYIALHKNSGQAGRKLQMIR